VEITHYFRVALYCDKACIGKFDYSVSETIEITPTWREEREAIDVGIDGEHQFHVEGVGRRTRYGAPVMGAWQGPPC
jgi:hypothetical protein